MVLLLILLSLSFNAFSLETDNYLSWKIDLDDSSQEINQFIETQIKVALDRSNNKKTVQNCHEVTNEIASRFRAILVHHNPMENWLLKHLDSNQMYPSSQKHVEQSIYRNPMIFYIPAFGLSPNIQVNGIYFGMDKLTHFSSTGRHYFNIFIRQKMNKKSDTDSAKSAIHYGLLDESTLHGHWASGVYSYADLEANYQGLIFFKKFCHDEKNTYLRRNPDQSWGLEQSPAIEDYVNPAWDESYNNSFFLTKNWNKIAPVLEEEYCPLRNDPKIRRRFNKYDRVSKKSFSQRYIESLEKGKSIFTPREFNQSLEELCRN